MGFLIAGVVLFAGAALFGDDGYTWLVALTGALAVVHGACTIVLRSRRRPGSGLTPERHHCGTCVSSSDG